MNLERPLAFAITLAIVSLTFVALVFGKNSKIKSGGGVMNYDQNIRYQKIKSFLEKEKFNGFTQKDLFIMSIVKKGWGHDIAALSNMAEALTNIALRDNQKLGECQNLLKKVIARAVHPKVNPYRKDIRQVADLGKFGYYLEHLNIILGSY